MLAYVNRTLDASLASSNAEHPAGSVSVKELYTSGQLSGWLVQQKTQATGAAGAGWYWYEVLSTSPGAPANAGNGMRSCVECHARGRDFVRTVYPLR